MFKDNLPERFFVLAVNGIFTTVPLTLLVGTKFLLSIAGYFVLSLFAIKIQERRGALSGKKRKENRSARNPRRAEEIYPAETSFFSEDCVGVDDDNMCMW